ncbi:MAG: S1C family serine protease, partial [Anaerolineae bacterium]|nr:S1C family serine protease [Anaerolineae bacterium]
RIASAYNLRVEFGAYVQAVQPGGPADTGGLQPADIIAAIADQAIDENNNLVTILMRFEPGQQAHITAVREGQEITVQVTLGTR